MKLLLENNVSSSETEILFEKDTSGIKRLYITGPFLMFNKENRNGRVYPEKVMDNAVTKYKKDYIDTSRALGEMAHPSDGRLSIEPERACIMTTQLEKDGDYYWGKAKVLSTPIGKILEALLHDGVKMGVSSRGVGSVTKRGSKSYVGDDYVIKTCSDVVYDPSVSDAFVQAIMEEKEYLLIDGSYVEKDLFEAKARIINANSSVLEEVKLKEIKNFFDSIKTK